MYKFKIDCKLTYEQIEQLSIVFATPDMGWNDSVNAKIYTVYLDVKKS